MADFFVSYTSADDSWAQWIAYVLEEAGFTLVVQAWDFRPGSNFVLEMQNATANSERTIIVLSPDYLNSEYAASEWATAFAEDPRGAKRKLVPVVVRECLPTGLLKALIHINLAGLGEAEAHRRLLEGLAVGRAKPGSRPSFPGARPAPPAFPGAHDSGHTHSAAPLPYVPKIRRNPSDLEKREFVRAAFSTIKNFFRHALVELGEVNPHVHGEPAAENAPDFSAELFVDGGNRADCRIWLGDSFMRDSICYAEGRQLFGSNACNEILTLSHEDGGLSLSATMDIGIRFGGSELPFDTKRMTTEQAAEYLWRRFVSRLE